MELNNKKITRLSITLIVSIFFIGVVWSFYSFYKGMLSAPIHMWKINFLVVVILCLVSIWLTMTAIWVPQRLTFLNPLRNRLGWLRWMIILSASIFIGWFFVYARWSEIFNGIFPRLYLYILAGIFVSWLAGNGECFFSWRGSLSAIVILCAAFTIAVNFQQVNDYPFTLYWSEGNRFWDYSILYGRHLYIYPADKEIPVYIDQGRQSLWGLPFLFLAQPSIWFMRFWSALMYTLPYTLMGWFVFKHQRGRLIEWILCGLWAMLFINQGPIYAPLVLAAILVAGAQRIRLVPALFLVGLAGYYARNCRITWTFAPAMWAGMVALIDSASPFARTTARRWVRAITLGLAGLSGFIVFDLWPPILARLQGIGSETSYVSIEGIQAAGSRQPLLWDRLLPNPTNPQGILIALLLAILPILVLAIVFITHKLWKFDLWQKLAIATPLLAFLVAGIIISVKIGGGSNLHNLDMLLLGILFVAGFAWNNNGRDWILESDARLPWWLRGVTLISIILPVGYQMLVVQPFTTPGTNEVNAALNYIQNAVDEAKVKGDVLFIDQRQLLTFGYITDVPLVADYEKKWMMDEAMANNAEYFTPFYQDLSKRRFSLIVSELMFIKWQGDEYNFGNENDAWVKWVSIPVHCYYEQVKAFDKLGIDLLLPRQEKLTDPKVICPVVEGE